MPVRCHLFSLGFVALVVSHAALAGEPLAVQANQAARLGIETVVAGQANNARRGTLPAKVVVPNEQMRVIAAPVAGLVEMLAVAPGSTVKKGQVVAHLASPQALELQRDALQAQSQATLQQQNLKRDEQLYAEGLIAESRLQATRAAASQASAQASERRQGLALTGALPGKLGGPLALTAPLDGVVLEQNVQLGQRVEASAAIYRIARLSPLWLEIQAPQEIAAHLKEGSPLKLANREITGKVTAIGRAVDPASQTVLLRATVHQGSDQLNPGQVVEVDVDGPVDSGISLPSSALVRLDGQTLAFVQTAADTQTLRFAPRAVNILRQGGDTVTVDGLRHGERVAIRGVSGLKAMLTGVGRE